jgi:hypothetical protein
MAFRWIGRVMQQQLGLAGVGIGLALQSAQQCDGRLSIISAKPYKVGEQMSLLRVPGDVVRVDFF